MGVLNLPNVNSNVGEKHPVAAAMVVSPLLQILGKNIAERVQENHEATLAKQMAQETPHNLNQVLGIPETVQDTNITPDTQGPDVKPNPEAFTADNFTNWQRPQQQALVAQAIERKMAPANILQVNKLIADRAGAELQTNPNLGGYQKTGLMKILASGDPAAAARIQKENDEMATGQGLNEYQRIKSDPTQQENAGYLKDFLMKLDPKLGEYSTQGTGAYKPDTSGNLIPTPQNQGGTMYSTKSNKLGEVVPTVPTNDPTFVAKTRAEAFGAIPTTTPGIYFDRIHKTYMTADGQKLSKDEVQKASIDYKVETPTETNKTMQQMAPKVLDFVKNIRQEMNDVKEQLGPAAGRWNEFMAGKVGYDNPAFTKLRTDLGLMDTALMRMHVGARGGEKMLEHFEGLINQGKQSYGNMTAALDSIERYATDVKGDYKGGMKDSGPAPSNSITTRSGNKFTVVGR